MNIVLRYNFSKIHSKVAIIGAGTAGFNALSHLLSQKNILKNQIRLFDPSHLHYYQPAWTMIGGGFATVNSTIRETRKLVDPQVQLTHLGVKKILPDQNTLICEDGSEWTYQQLIIATGNQLRWDLIKNAKEHLEDPASPVGSIYWHKYAQKFQDLVKQTKGGNVIFTEPQFPIKCAGAPQKILYLTHDILGGKANISFHKTVNVMFGVPKYAEILKGIAKQKNIEVTYQSKLVEIKDKNTAIFENQNTKELTELKFDLLHIVPPQSPHSFIAESGLGDAQGYVNVHKNTLQHVKYSNIWSLGDCSSLPTSKTAAAIMSQGPILAENLSKTLNNEKIYPENGYEGYASCPLFVGNKKLLLAEFKYDGVIDETFPWLQGKPRSLFYYMKTHLFPFVYWHLMPKGLWHGRDGFIGRSWRQ